MPEPDQTVELDPADIRTALAHILASPPFDKSTQLANFLRFVVEETLAGSGDRIKAYTIATAALGRGDDFDPQTDPIVRVEAGRLRRALHNYYASAGHDQPIVIDLPIGRYTPIFRANQQQRPGVARFRLWRLQGSEFLRENRKLLLLMVSIAIVVTVAVDLTQMLFSDVIWPLIFQSVHRLPDIHTTGCATR